MSDRMEAELAGWLRELEPGAMPIALRMRAFADLRTEAGRGRTRLPWLKPTFSSVVSTAAVLAAGAVILFTVLAGQSTSSAGAPGPVWPGPATVPAPDSRPTGGLDAPWLVALLTLALLAGGAVRLPRVRRLGRWLAGDGEVARAVLVFPRRLREVPPLAIAMATLSVAEVVVAYRLYGPANLGYVISVVLPAALAPAIALRYSMAERSGRWLLIGGVAIAMAPLPGMGLTQAVHARWLSPFDWGAFLLSMSPLLALALEALGWLALATGIASRSGLVPRPRGLVVGAATALVLYVQMSWALQFGAILSAAEIALPPQDVARLACRTLAMCLIDFASLSILWTAVSRVRRNGTYVAWLLAMAAASVHAVALAYASLTYHGLLEWPDILIPWPVEWLSLGALLIGLLIALEPARPEPSSGSSDSEQPVDATAPRPRRLRLRRLPRL